MNITIVVLAGPDEATTRFDDIRNHIVNKTMLVPETSSLELRLISAVVDLLEDILEATIVFLENCVLGCHVAGVVLAESI